MGNCELFFIELARLLSFLVFVLSSQLNITYKSHFRINILGCFMNKIIKFQILIFVVLASIKTAVCTTEKNTVQGYCAEYAINQQNAEQFLKETMQSVVDDTLAGKFSPRELIEKIKGCPVDLVPYLKEESIVLILKNIKYNAEIENMVSPELVQDLAAILEAMADMYEDSGILKVLKSGINTQSSNEALKAKIKEIVNKVKDKIEETTADYIAFHAQLADLVTSNEYFNRVSKLDKETMFLIDLLQTNAQDVVALCQSDEIKHWYYKLAFDDKDRLKKIARAFILRFASEVMLDSQFKHASFNALDFISITTKVMSCMKAGN